MLPTCLVHQCALNLKVAFTTVKVVMPYILKTQGSDVAAKSLSPYLHNFSLKKLSTSAIRALAVAFVLGDSHSKEYIF